MRRPVYYASEKSANDRDVLMRSSSDGGATWSAATTVAGAMMIGRDGVSTVYCHRNTRTLPSAFSYKEQ